MSEITDKWKNLRRDMGNLISQLDGSFAKLEAEEKRMEQKRDESYIQGAEDMRKAINTLYDTKLVESSSIKLEELFDTDFIPNIFSRHPAAVIIDGVKQFLERKEQDFQVGDEIEITDPTITSNGEKRIVTRVGINSICLIDSATFNATWIEKEHAKKTGKHYDAIPFNWKGEKLKVTKFKVGDEVEHLDHRNGSCNKYIVIKADSDSDVLWLLDLRSFLRIWIYKDDSSLKKTGKHFDTIDIPEGGATI